MAWAFTKKSAFPRVTTDDMAMATIAPLQSRTSTQDEQQLDDSTDQTPFLQDTSDRASTDALKIESNLDIENDSTRQNQHARINKRSRLYACASSPIWLISTLILLTIVITQNILATHYASYNHGFSTDISALKPALKMQKTRFKSAIRDLPNATMHVPEPALDSKARQFTGPPSDEIDAAWDDLIHGRYERFTDSEVAWLNADAGLAAVVPIDEPQAEWMRGEAGVYGGPDMLHSLHCLNGLRKHFDYDYYAERNMLMAGDQAERMHVEHCIEQLRQAVLCHGDITPVTLKPVYKGDRLVALLGQTERAHTCRDGEAIVEEWKRQRGRRGYAGE
ncbi:Dimethylamine methyltransferase MtbB1 [Teratosphaeria destructans]|uniref:Dimethylamine methyltransferase MtbB1 n=1 Tax=Teratosphaeria destructans TaxID=418781 RepID=A0A9W7SMF4_9PEZI|nr:Dimethylamine methyltransferase MtbB1 [Teratosphaeria destructans]